MPIILGVDEAGRGCWAGPLVVGAVALREPIVGLNDSKLLTKRQRQQLSKRIFMTADVGLGWVEAKEVDTLGLTKAIRLAILRALETITSTYDEIIIDGNLNFLTDNPKAKAIIKADMTIAAVSAASIVAKVARDTFMCKQAIKYPAYGFERHVGYGTKHHQQMIQLHGVCAIHRLSFKPLRGL